MKLSGCEDSSTPGLKGWSAVRPAASVVLAMQVDNSVKAKTSLRLSISGHTSVMESP